MSYTKNFFDEKNDWSKHKDTLLNRYIVPYLVKVMTTKVDIITIDGFAGKGKFEDGTLGSPLIIKDGIYKAKSISKSQTKIFPYFIEYEHAEVLRKNLSDKNAIVISGDYRKEAPKILSENKGKNIFLYVDPFGIKYLDFEIFKNLKPEDYNSIELLLNLNSFGFIREGCRLLKCKQEDFDDDLPEQQYESDTTKNTIENMNKIANGDYWISIIKGYHNGDYDIFEAENRLLLRYKEELHKVFNYVYSIPIKKSKGRLSKYQMIFATNNKHGILLMADNMIDCNRRMENDLNHGQLCLFDYEYSLTECQDFMLNELPNKLTELKDFYVHLYKKKGFIYPTKDMNGALKTLESEGKVLIERYPATTKTGKTSKSMDFYKNTIKIKRI